MGRVGEVTTRNWQTADKMKKMTGKLPEDNPRNDNFRVMRYLAKITINPAITHGISDYVGSIQPGRLARSIWITHQRIRNKTAFDNHFWFNTKKLWRPDYNISHPSGLNRTHIIRCPT